jgi:DNA-binding PadR family transcriptional regulator
MKESIEESAEFFEEQMKKGFISALILLVLEHNDCHGYKILKEIEERTLGIWQPSTSTIYHLLDSMQTKNLVECVKAERKGRQKKIFRITPSGIGTLERLLEKYKKMQDSMHSILFSTISLTDNLKEENLEELLDFRPPLLLFEKNNYTIEETVKMLKIRRKMLANKIERHRIEIQNIDDKLNKLENKK